MRTQSVLTLILAAAAAVAQVKPAASTDPAALANLPAHPIGANDLITISVYDSPELSRSARVGADGFIRMPMVKQRIKAQGLLPSELEAKIAEALKAEEILIDPVVTVGVAEYHSRPISVAGSVRSPITFQAAGPMTLLQAISKAGGLEKTAGPEILLTRGADTLHIPVKGLIESADPKWNMALTGGEDIRVPEAGKIFVVGNVKKPGAFPSPDLTDATVLKAIALSEGLLPFSAKQAYIYRPNVAGERTEIAVNLSKILERKSQDMQLQPEDILYIPDNRGKKLGMAALERALTFGSTAGATALIYAH